MAENSPPGPETVAARVGRALERRFGVDTRALAALRVSLGTLLVLDLLLRARELRAHYTDGGVLPVALLAERYPTLSRLSLHALSGDAWFQALLFALAAACALALVVGYRTRAATAASLALLVSLHVRNLYVLNGGDALLQHLLFWSLFLPLGARWSVDARRQTRSRNRIASVASAGLLLQVVLVYGVNAVLKHRSDVWLSGEAVPLVLELDQFAVLAGPVLRDLPAVFPLANWVWLGAVSVAPLLVLLTGRRRVALVCVFGTMHLGMLLTMRLGVFPLVSVTALLPFLPPAVWDGIERARRLRATGSVLLDRFESVLPEFGRTVIARWSGWLRGAGRVVATVALACILLFNAIGLGVVSAPPPANDALSESRLDLRWVMFADPPTTDRWYVAPGRLESGARVDALGGGAVRRERPDDVAGTYPSARTRKYMSHLRRDERLQSAFPAFLCDRWRRTHGSALANVSLYAVETPSRNHSAGERTELVAGSCDSG